MRWLITSLFLIASVASVAQGPSSDENTVSQAAPVRTEFRVKYVNGTDVYIDGGRDSGLAEGTAIVLKQAPSKKETAGHEESLDPGILARLTVISVASSSAVCQVDSSTRELAVGDFVTLPQPEVEKLIEKNTLGNTRKYPMIISFTEGDPLEEEVRDAIPHPPLPEVNQARGRIGFDFSTMQGLGSNGFSSTTFGMVARADITRISGTHFNLNGYWRGRIQSTAAPARSSIQDLINRTYQMSLTYVNPESHWTAGIGRLYLPWASSLEVIDGGYVARRMSSNSILGVFGGSTPDPTAWNYDPKRKLNGLFVNTHGGSFEEFRYSSTEGGGVELLGWSVDKPFFFAENDLSFKRIFSLYHSMQIDRPTANPSTPALNYGVGQSLLSLRLQVHPRVGFDLTHTYFRDVPTYDASLVGTGLLDKYLFQGVNGGARIEFPQRITGYFTVGRSSTSSDAKGSWNTMGGASMARIWKTGLTADARYSKFNSAFATGTYRTLTVSRELNESLRLNLQAGRQAFASPLSKDNGSYFGNFFVDANIGARYFVESSFTTQRGGTQEYNQWTSTFGYRFDNRSHARMAAKAMTSQSAAP